MFFQKGMTAAELGDEIGCRGVLPLLSLFLERAAHTSGQEAYPHVSTLPTEFLKALGKMLINYALSYRLLKPPVAFIPFLTLRN